MNEKNEEVGMLADVSGADMVTAAIVTRGDQNAFLSGIYEGLSQWVDAVKVWDNSKAPADLKVFGRYVAAAGADTPVIYTQDDDVLVSLPEAVLSGYKPGRIVCNMPAEYRPHYSDGVALVGFGCVFDADLPRLAFDRYLKYYPMDALFLVECDRIFTGLSKVEFTEVPFQHADFAISRERLWRRPNHFADLHEIRRRIYEIQAKENHG